MTTIATDGKSMAADGRMVAGSRILREDDEKIAKVFVEKAGETLLVGTAGTIAHVEALLEFIKDNYMGNGVFLGTPFDPEDSIVEDGPHPQGTEALILTPSGRVFMAGFAEPVIEVGAYQGLGSGGDVALGAMLAGKRPGEAVLIASRVDNNTNGNVTEIHIGKA